MKQWGVADACVHSNTAPVFVGITTTLTVSRSAGATDIKSLLLVSDSDHGQTETWTQSVAPSHGTLSVAGATASSGRTDITPGGTLTYTPTPGYSGSDSFTIQVSDGTATDTRTISVSVMALPGTTVTTAALSADTGGSGTDWITQTAGQTITGTLSGNLASDEKVQVSCNDGSTWADATTSTVGSSSWSTTTTLSGSSTFAARVYNAVGSSATWTHTYTLDSTAPAPPSTPDLNSGSDSGRSSTDNETSFTTLTFTGTAESGTTVTLYQTDGITVMGTGLATDGTWSITCPDLIRNNYTITAVATDSAGNSGPASAGLPIVMTLFDPIFAGTSTNAFSDLAFSADTGASSTDFITRTAAQTISATLSQIPAVTDSVYGSLDNGSTWTNITTKVSGTTLSWNGVTLTTSSNLKLKVTNAYGDGSISSQAYVLDTTAPAVISVAVPADATYIAGQNLDFTVNWSEEITVAGTDSTLEVTIGSALRTAAFFGKSTSSMTYRYTVMADDSDTDGVTIGAMTLHATTIKDLVENDAILTLNAVGDLSGVLVGNTVPIATPASAISSSSFNANWSSVSGAIGYLLDVANDYGFTSLVTGYDDRNILNVTTFTVTGLTVDSTYYYRVRAYDSLGTATNSSNSIRLTTLSGQVTGIAVDPAQPLVLYAGVDGEGVYLSTDSGASWHPPTTPPSFGILALAISPLNPAILFAASHGAGIYTSIDSGDHWILCGNGGLSGAALNTLALAIDSAGQLYAGTEGGIFTSSDCAVWSDLNTGLTVHELTPPVALVIDSADASKLYAGLDGAGVYRSSDSGATWQPANSQPANPQVRALAMKNSTQLYAATYGDGVYTSSDSGDTWSACANTNLTNLNMVSLTSDSNGKLYAGTEAGVFVSIDNCTTWTEINNGLPN